MRLLGGLHKRDNFAEITCAAAYSKMGKGISAVCAWVRRLESKKEAEMRWSRAYVGRQCQSCCQLLQLVLQRSSNHMHSESGLANVLSIYANAVCCRDPASALSAPPRLQRIPSAV